ncbi:MAG: hypothetical protein QXT86_11255 [Archaeoglobaceae archaeon]
MFKKMLTLFLSLFILNLAYANSNANSNPSLAIEELNQNVQDVIDYYRFVSTFIQNKKNIDAFTFIRAHEMFVLSKLFSRGNFCVAALAAPFNVYERLANLDKDISKLLQALCIAYFNAPDSFIASRSGSLLVSSYRFYLDDGIITRIEWLGDKKISIIPADLYKYKELFFQRPIDFSKIFEQEFIVSVQLEPTLKSTYKTRPVGGITEIFDISSVIDIKRNFTSLANITYNELVLYLLEYYRETVKEKDMHSSFDFITKFMTSLLEQEKFVNWLSQKYSNQLIDAKKSKDAKDIKTQKEKRRGVK